MVTIIVCDSVVRIGQHERLTWPACSMGAEDCCVLYLKECDGPSSCIPAFPQLAACRFLSRVAGCLGPGQPAVATLWCSWECSGLKPLRLHRVANLLVAKPQLVFGKVTLSL